MKISAWTTVSLEAHGKVRAGARVLPTVIRKVIRHVITLAVAGVALTACDSLESSSPNLASLIRTSLDAHRGFHVQSVACPAGPRGKGAVVHCTVTLRGGHKVGVRAIALDGHGRFRILTSEILPDNVERAIVAALARRSIIAKAVCPEHVLAGIGRRFHCTVTAGADRHALATVTIIDADGGFRFDVR